MQRIYCLNKQIAAALQLSLPKRSYATKKQTKNTVAAAPAAVAPTITPPSVPKIPPDEVTTENSINAGFLARTCGASYKKWDKAIQSYPLLRKVKRNDFMNTFASLKALNYTLDDMLSKPMILYTNAITIENRYSVLKECGFETISIAILNKYVTVMNKSVSYLKSHNYLSYELDVVRKLCECFSDLQLEMPSNECNEDMELKLIRQNILNLYLRQRLQMTDSDITKLWKVYGRIRHKSFTSVRKIIDLLLSDLKFSNERINKNAYLLYADVENVKRILKEIPSISGHEMREIVYRRPKILMSSCDTLLRTLNHVKSFGIGEDAILRCLEVLTLGSDTVLERLHDLNEVEEFQVLCSNPRILRLVHYQNKARLRLEYLNQLKVRCASLHILSCGSEAFEKFARDGSDRTKGRDIVVYLSNVMGKDEHKIRNLLSRHPNWCHIPAMQVKQCYDFLISKKFNADSIYNNIHLLLYPIKRIEEKLHELYRNELLDGIDGLVNVDQLSNNELLTLILYFIECEFHFTGDGIWTEQHAHHVENFNNLLPDFPESLNKVYKYGMKPASSSSAAIAQKLFMTQ